MGLDQALHNMGPWRRLVLVGPLFRVVVVGAYICVGWVGVLLSPLARHSPLA